MFGWKKCRLTSGCSRRGYRRALYRRTFWIVAQLGKARLNEQAAARLTRLSSCRPLHYARVCDMPFHCSKKNAK
jgi:hypothetical protein